MVIKILGVSGSPRKDGNTDLMVREALRGAAQIPDVETDFVSLRGKLSPCIDCDKCPVSADRFCAISDKMDEIYPKLVECDGMLIGAPTYFGTITAQMKCMMDRCRPLGRAGEKLAFKVGGALTVGACRNGGQENALTDIIEYFVLSGIFPVGLCNILQAGAVGLAFRKGKIEDDYWTPEFIPDSKVTAFSQSYDLGMRVAAIARMIKAGMAVENPHQFISGWKMEKDKIK